MLRCKLLYDYLTSCQKYIKLNLLIGENVYVKICRTSCNYQENIM